MENEKQRKKIKELSQEVAELEQQLQNTQHSKKTLQTNFDEVEEERAMTKQNYNKLLS